MITRHTSKMFVMEGQEVSLRCKSIGDPEPSTHWVSPDGKLIGNTSRTICYENGSLDILKASVKVEKCFIFKNYGYVHSRLIYCKSHVLLFFCVCVLSFIPVDSNTKIKMGSPTLT